MNYLALLLFSVIAVTLGQDPTIVKYAACPGGQGRGEPPDTECGAREFKCFNPDCYRCENGLVVEGLCLGAERRCCHKPCDAGWSYFNQSCFMLETQKMNWFAARANCQMYGGDLASIHSAAEQAHVNAMHTLNVWIGLCDKVSESEFIWSDGSQYDYENWHNFQPNNFIFLQHCTENVNWQGTKRWNDNLCSFPFQSICRKDIFP